MFSGRGPGGPKESAWTRIEGASLASFFERQRVRHSPAAYIEHLEWTYSLDGENTHTARVPINSLVSCLVIGLSGTVLRKGCGTVPGEGSCEAYWSKEGQELAEEEVGAQKLVRGGTGDLEIRRTDGSTCWCSARHVSPCEAGQCGEVNEPPLPATPPPQAPPPPQPPQPQPPQPQPPKPPQP